MASPGLRLYSFKTPSEDKHNYPPLGCSLIGAATSELAELSASVQNAALSAPPVLAHPNSSGQAEFLGSLFQMLLQLLLHGVR